MGFYDPSTLNMPTSNAPVMLGGPDPYQMYDPYTSLLPSTPEQGQDSLGGTQPGYMLTPEVISKEFADTSKYSLEAQRLKAEEAAKKKKEEEKGGKGKNPQSKGYQGWPQSQ